MNVNEAIAYIHSVYWKGSVYGLSRIQTLLEKLGNPQNSMKYVHIAGTNGKGSTAAMTASILRKAGYRTGLYTSPYIYRFNERMQVDGEQISDEDVVAVTESVVARAQGNYASIDAIAKDVRAKLGGETIGVIFPILSRNRFAICLRGIAMGAKKIVLLANGVKKHDAVMKLLDNTITTKWPATLLKVHPDVTLICDRAAYEG
jgi:hypothetical protein